VHRHILPFLFMRDPPTISLLGGLVVEDQYNGLREVPILMLVIFSLGLRQSGRLPI
jgi:hypothetical protein